MSDLFNNIIKGANFSTCGEFRYSLWRIWDDSKPLVMFIGLNPSKADSKEDDNTIKRVKSIAFNLGYGGFYMVNCFPYISTNPKLLNQFGNTEFNDHVISVVSKMVKDVVFAWGNFKIVKNKGRDIELKEMFPNAFALYINKNGSPKHPLFCKSKTQLIKYDQTRT